MMKLNLISGNGTALFDLFNFSGAETLSPGVGKNDTLFQSLLFNVRQDAKLLNPVYISKFTKMADGNSELSEMLSGLMFSGRDAVSIEPAQIASTEQQTLSVHNKTSAWNEIVARVEDELSLKMAKLGQELFNRAAGDMERMPATGKGNSKSGEEPEVNNILWVGMPLSPELVTQLQALLQTGSVDIGGDSVQPNLNFNEQNEGIVSVEPVSDPAQNPVMSGSKLPGVAWMAANVLKNYQSGNNRGLQGKTEHSTGNPSQNPANGFSGNEIYLQLFAEDEPTAATGMAKEMSAASELSKLMSGSEIGALPQSAKMLSSLISENSAMQSANLPLKQNSPVSDEKIFTVPGTQLRISSRDLPLTENGVVAIPMAESGSEASVSVLPSQDANQFAFLITDAANHFLRELPETAADPENGNLLFYSRSAKGFIRIVHDPLVNLPTGVANSTGDTAKTPNLFPANGELNKVDLASPQQTVTKVLSSLNEEIASTAGISQPKIIRMIRIANTIPVDQTPERQLSAGTFAITTAKNFIDGKNTIFEQTGERHFLKTSGEVQPSIRQQPAENGELPLLEMSNTGKSDNNIFLKSNNMQQMVDAIAGRIIAQYQNKEMEMPNSPVAITPENSEQVYFSTEKNNGQIIGILQADEPKVAEQLREIVPGLTKELQEQKIPVAKLQVQVKENRLLPEQVNQQAGKEVVKQITGRIAAAIQTFHVIKEKETVKQLQPENPGGVKITVVKESGGFAVSLQVERPELKKIIEAESSNLKKSLKQKNIPVKSIEVKNTSAQFTVEEKIHLSEQELKHSSFQGEPFVDHNLLRKTSGVKMPEISGRQGHFLSKEIPLKQVMDQIVRSTRLQYLPGKTQIQIHLKPEYLGAVTIVMKDNGKEVRGVLYAERPEIRQALESQLPVLQKSLQEQNIRFDKLDIQDYSSQFAQQNHSQNTREEESRQGNTSDFSMNHGGGLKNSGGFDKTDRTKTIRNFGYNTMEFIA